MNEPVTKTCPECKSVRRLTRWTCDFCGKAEHRAQGDGVPEDWMQFYGHQPALYGHQPFTGRGPLHWCGFCPIDDLKIDRRRGKGSTENE